MTIPKLQYISEGNTPEEHLENIQNACTSGAELVQLSLMNASEETILEIAIAAREITSHFQTRLIINTHYKIAKTVKADGVHLEKSDTSATVARIHLYTWQMIGGTANTLQECEALLSEEVDYINLGPFKSTKEDPSTLLGINGYSAIIDALNTETPIIGFGSIKVKDVKNILKTGITGIGVSEEITRNFDSIKVFNQLLSASSTDELRHTFE
ncbi:thiamine phosphate synthase [Polaribacter sp.]|jgi:thiamine-phosphate pyrophosphorylase|nr:thiamine phosphate synthase [Polaribacter sp.]|tara:strand:+ start:5163 stop:5801 length:639 start_codon:yes stop_codon:yes gene_type:complete